MAVAEVPGARPAKARHSSTVLRRWLIVALGIAVGVGLLTLAVPRTVAAWCAMDGNEVYQTLALGRSVPGERIDSALAGLDVALDWVPSSDRYYMRAAAELERYRRLPETSPARNVWLARAGRDLKAGLGANPADGRASLLLAMVRAWQGASGRDVVIALLHSMDTMPSLRPLLLTRATVFFAAWGALSPDEAAAVRSQLRAIWQNDPGLRLPLLQAARASGHLDALALALVDEPAAREEFETLLGTPASTR